MKQMGFEPGPEDSYGRCGSDKIRRTVREVKSSVTDGRQPGDISGDGHLRANGGERNVLCR